MTEIAPGLRAAMESTPYGQKLGFRLLELGEGYARVAVTIGPQRLNFIGNVDGGLIMSLADYAFGCSSNTFGQVRVAAQFSTNFIAAPTVKGDLIAEGKTIHAGRSMAFTEITVTDERGRLIAKAMGTTITLPSKAHPQDR